MRIIIVFGFGVVMVVARCLASVWFTICWIMEIRVTPCMGLHDVSNPTKKRKGDWASVKVGDFEDWCGGQKQGKDPMAAVPVEGCVDFFF